MSKVKEKRNKELVKKKKAGWSFRQLANHFNITVSRAHEIWEENRKKSNVRGVDNSGS